MSKTIQVEAEKIAAMTQLIGEMSARLEKATTSQKQASERDFEAAKKTVTAIKEAGILATESSIDELAEKLAAAGPAKYVDIVDHLVGRLAASNEKVASLQERSEPDRLGSATSRGPAVPTTNETKSADQTWSDHVRNWQD